MGIDQPITAAECNGRRSHTDCDRKFTWRLGGEDCVVEGGWNPVWARHLVEQVRSLLWVQVF